MGAIEGEMSESAIRRQASRKMTTAHVHVTTMIPLFPVCGREGGLMGVLRKGKRDGGRQFAQGEGNPG